MTRLSLLAAGAAAGVLGIREHRGRKHAERLAAALLETLLRAIDANDTETGQHVRRVARYALVLADEAGLDDRARRSVERIALFHDIGKIDQALFDIIHDESSLTDDERKAIEEHPRRGAEVLAPLSAFYPELPEGVLSHHERWDGTGYPRRLVGDEIPLAARIVTIADSFDAVTASRRYSGARSAREARSMIDESAGAQFDPTLAALFLSPRVSARIDEAIQDGQAAPRRRRASGRSERVEQVPDVTFRWRTTMLSPLRAGRAADDRRSETRA